MALSEQIIELITISHEESKQYVDQLFAKSQESLKLLKSSPVNNVGYKRSLTEFKKRFNRIVFTPLGTRVMLPSFGSNLHELIDKPMNYEWKLLLKKYLFECFFDENERLWDEDFCPVGISFVEVEAENGFVGIEVKFKNETEVSFNV